MSYQQPDPYRQQPYEPTRTQPLHFEPAPYGTPAPPPGGRHAPSRGLPWWGTALIAAGTFVAGCLGGVVVAGVDPEDDEPAAAEATTSAVTDQPTASPTEEAQATEAPTEPSAEPVPLTIPDDLVGRNAAIVDDQLRELGFINVSYASADADDTVVLLLQNWTVVEVEPQPGTEVESDSLVIVTCSKQT